MASSGFQCDNLCQRQVHPMSAYYNAELRVSYPVIVHCVVKGRRVHFLSHGIPVVKLLCNVIQECMISDLEAKTSLNFNSNIIELLYDLSP